MQTRRLGRTGLDITPVGFGAWAIGGGAYKFGWGEQDEADALAAIDRAVEEGLGWIDTAAVYGLGRSERLIGRALEGRRERPLVFTKCGRTWDDAWTIGGTLTADSIRRECDASLERLGVDALDLYQIHWPDPEADIEEGWETLAALKEEALVRHIGVSNFSVVQLRRLAPIAPVETLQPPYSLIRPDAEDELLPYCAEHDIGVLVYSPMASGLLTGAMTRARVAAFPADDWRSRNPEFREPRLGPNLELVETLRRVGGHHGASPGEVAVAWTLRDDAVSGAIVGGRSAEQVSGTAGAGRLRLTEEDLAEIDEARERRAAALG